MKSRTPGPPPNLPRLITIDCLYVDRCRSEFDYWQDMAKHLGISMGRLKAIRVKGNIPNKLRRHGVRNDRPFDVNLFFLGLGI